MRLASDLQGRGPTLIRQIMNAAPAGTISLGLGQPVLDTPDCMARAAALAAPAHNAYTPNLGLPELRARIGASYGLDADHVAITAGAEQALFLAICGALEPGDELLVPELAFSAYPLIAEWRGASVRRYPLLTERGYGIDPDAVLACVTERTRLVLLNTPHNPTGAVLETEALRALLAGLAERGVPYLSDEVYASFDFRPGDFRPGDPARPGALRENRPSHLSPGCTGLTIDSFSKRLALMGWRIGWLVGPPSFIAGIVPLQQMIVTCASTPLQVASLAAFTDEGLAAADQVALAMCARRAIALEGVRALPGVPPPSGEGALYLMIDTSHLLGGDDIALAFRLLDFGVATIPGQAFGQAGRGRLRLSFGAEPDALAQGFERLAAGLRALG